MSDLREKNRTVRIGFAVMSQRARHYAREFLVAAAEDERAGFPDVAAEGRAEAAECLRDARRFQRLAQSWGR